MSHPNPEENTPQEVEQAILNLFAGSHERREYRREVQDEQRSQVLSELTPLQLERFAAFKEGFLKKEDIGPMMEHILKTQYTGTCMGSSGEAAVAVLGAAKVLVGLLVDGAILMYGDDPDVRNGGLQPYHILTVYQLLQNSFSIDSTAQRFP